MPRLTIIGTSHVGAFKEGWEAVAPAHPGWTVTFFAATSKPFQSLRLTQSMVFGLPRKVAAEDASLRAAIRRVNGATSTDLGDADAVLWAGFRHPFDALAGWLAERDVEGLSVGSGRPVVSRAAFDAACDAIARRCVPSERWLGWRNPALVLHPCPVPAETLLADAGDALRNWVAFAGRPVGQRAILDAFASRHEAALAAAGVGLLRQPADTLLPNGLTAARFTAGSHRLGASTEHPLTDHTHMNVDYGALALTAVFAQLEAARALTAVDAIPASAGPKRRGATATKARRRKRGEAASSPSVAAAAEVRRITDAAARAARSATPCPTVSPYLDLPARAYWRSGVADRAPLDPGDLYRPRFPVTRGTRIATAGSCFAQHVGRSLRAAGHAVIDAEPLPAEVPDATAHRFGYRLFSARYANIYTARQLAQLYDEATGGARPALPVWRRGARFFDAQRPGVEPDGLESEDLVLSERATHLAAVRTAFHTADVVVFTFGLTEAWVHAASGTVYPTAPGTIAGEYDPDIFAFRNFDALDVLEDFERFRGRLRAANPDVRFLVTVSPVPLTATASGDHVEVATCYSKSVLRAVCGMLVARHADIDYFPSFELITAQNARGIYFEANQRSVSTAGVAAAMGLFQRAHGISTEPKAGPPPHRARRAHAGRAPIEVEAVCEDVLLDAFAR